MSAERCKAVCFHTYSIGDQTYGYHRFSDCPEAAGRGRAVMCVDGEMRRVRFPRTLQEMIAEREKRLG